MAGWNEVLAAGLSYERHEALAQPHSHRLEVLGLVAALERFERLLPAPPRAREELCRLRGDRSLTLLEIREAQAQPEMERQHHVAALEVRLAVEVGRSVTTHQRLSEQCTSQMS